jgi:signal transduction histidine kinase
VSSAERILIVDDNATNRRILVGSLQKAGYATREACDGNEALDVAGTWGPDLVLLDVSMPGCDGFEVCEILRSREATASTPIIFLTALTGPTEIERAFAVGGSDYVTKPFHMKEVKARVSVHLQVHRTARELRDAHGRLVQAQKLEAVGQLAAGIAHEINTPTQYIGDNTHFLKDAFGDLLELLDAYGRMAAAAESGSVDDALRDETRRAVESADPEYLREEIPKALEGCLEGIERVSSIVSAMKAFSHPGGEGMSVTDINKAIESTATICRNEWKYHAEMDMHLDADLPHVTCLPGEINQVLLNVIVNAAQAIAGAATDAEEKAGRITVTTRRVGESIEIRIRDNGPGIPPEIRSRVFEPFFTTKAVGKGTGQGLAIAYNVIAEKHGGSIDVESQPGEGTTFVIRLPLAQREAAA